MFVTDLMSMMMQCSDLKAPQKAKGFHKPSLIEVQRTGSDHGGRAPVFHESDHARRWTSTEDLEGLFVVQCEHKQVQKCYIGFVGKTYKRNTKSSFQKQKM